MSLMNIDANVFELLRNKIQQCRKRVAQYDDGFIGM